MHPKVQLPLLTSQTSFLQLEGHCSVQLGKYPPLHSQLPVIKSQVLFIQNSPHSFWQYKPYIDSGQSLHSPFILHPCSPQEEQFSSQYSPYFKKGQLIHVPFLLHPKSPQLLHS